MPSAARHPAGAPKRAERSVGGLIIFLTGLGLWSGQTWARAVAVIVAALNALVQLTIMPAYPFWAVLMVALNMVVIYAVIVHGREAQVA